MSQSVQDADGMRRAAELARRGRPSPNPHVGAVVIKDGVVVGEGFHALAGGPHAEVVALDAAGPAARGATLYVTLEPCNHHGRTPPCTERVVQSGVARVVVGTLDPNPHVAGGGVHALIAAGIETAVGLAAVGEVAECTDALVRPWAKYVTRQMPYVALKLALTLDGRIATKTGHSRWITGPVARAKVHQLRARYDAVAVGVGTLLADDPALTVRDAPGLDPKRIVVDSALRTPLAAKLVQTARDVPTVILTALDGAVLDHERALVDAGVIIVRCARQPSGRVDLAQGFAELATRGIVSVMVEGGAELAGSVLAAELADELHAFIAPMLFGPRGRAAAVDWAGPDAVAEAPCIENPKWELCDGDAYVHGLLRRTAS